MSNQATPAASASSRLTALNASISAAIRALSRPVRVANGVTPQSGIETTNTRDGSPPASATARSSSPSNAGRYASALPPRN